MENIKDNKLEKLVALCKRRGFVFQGSEIYGGLSGMYDLGPLGVELTYNIKQLWWKMFISRRDDVYPVDAAIIMNPRVWEASGHVATFTDPLIECSKCKSQWRADKIIQTQNVTPSDEYLCPYGGCRNVLGTQKEIFTKVRPFKLMLETKVGAGESSI